MRLTDDEQRILDGKDGPGRQKAMELVVALGNTFDAERLIPVSRAHVALSGQEGDTYWCELLVDGGATCVVPPTTNPFWDVDRLSRRYLVTTDEAALAMKTLDVYRRIGAKLTFHCAPGLGSNVPAFGEHVAFSESSATPYVNAVLGARSNRESSSSALASAVVGKTAYYGFHLEENRRGDVLIDVDATLNEPYDWGLLGYRVGQIAGSKIPVLRFRREVRWPRPEAFLYFGAEAATSGAVAMYHMVGLTPEAPTVEKAFGGCPVPESWGCISDKDLKSEEEHLSERSGPVNLVMLGCPHYTYEQLLDVAGLIRGRHVHPNVAFWILASHEALELVTRNGLRGELESAGVQIVADTCIDEPCWKSFEGGLGVSDSPKCAYYRERRGQPFVMRRLSDCIDAAVEGRVD